ncbi:MAG: DegT/DnrJ/EryC1/StrS family aminotransferase, partial [Nanoarchaeota archaeon]
LYENKIIHAEEGGIATTNKKEYADKMRYFKNQAFNKEHNFFHKDIGYNYRMANSQAKLALESLKNVKIELMERRGTERVFELMFPSKMPKRDVVWVYDYLGKPKKEYQTRPFFKPLSSFPMYGGKCKSLKALYYSRIGNYIKL